MLIMALSYAQATGDNSVLSATYTLLAQWTTYLIADSLIPANQYVPLIRQASFRCGPKY